MGKELEHLVFLSFLGPSLALMCTHIFTYSLFILQLDGYVARKLKINSVLGSYLDPLADKVEASAFPNLCTFYSLSSLASLTPKPISVLNSPILVQQLHDLLFQVLIGCVALAMVKKDLLHGNLRSPQS